MKVYDAAHIKNIAIVGHGGDGKTTLAEAFLANAGLIERRGRVEDGNTTTDYDPEEARRQISLTAAMAPVEWQDVKLNFIDAPGFFDFVGETTQAYYLADSALIVVNGFSGVGVGAEKAYEFCKNAGKPMAVLVNQMDREHADYDKVVGELKQKFGAAVTPLQIPLLKGQNVVGYIDIVENAAYEYTEKAAKAVPIPEDLQLEAEELREGLIENAASSDEALMEKFFGGEQLDKEDILAGLRTGILHGDIIPVFAASALQNAGVKELLDALAAYLPAAAEMPPMQAKNEKGEPIEIARSSQGEFVGQVLKTIADPFVGKISLVKILRGVLRADTQLYNSSAEKAEKFGNVSVMLGKKVTNVVSLEAGDIGALAKLQFTKTGDTLCSAADKVVLERAEFGKPCICLAISAKKQGEEDKVISGLRRMEEEDPTFTLSKNTETGDMLAYGMGELHIEAICNKLKNKFGIEAVLREPKVAYRETIRKSAEAEGRHKKQSGGAGQFGVVSIRFEPLADGSTDFEFVNAIVGGVVPKEFIPAVEKGLRECMQKGVLAGYPMVGVKATLFDGKYHPVDSKEVAFKSAARLAYKAACPQASPVLLEPIGRAEIVVPDEYMGDIMGDMNRRRGRILGMEPQEGGKQKILAEAPMGEMARYATDLRSMTQGRGTFEIAFERYEELPAQMAAKVIEQAKKDIAEDE